MALVSSLGVAAAVATQAAVASPPGDAWPAWRGPNGNGVANGPEAPVHWNESTNIIWKVPVPGRGHGSPTVIGQRIFLPTAEDKSQVQSVLAFDRATGQMLWHKQINQGGFPDQIHAHNTHATPTIAADAERLFVVFHHRNSIHVTALDHNGNPIWQKTAGPYRPTRYRFGYAPSPLLYQDLVIVSAEADADAYLVALDTADGNERWRIKRKPNVTFSSPIVGHVAGRDQLLISGGDQVASYEPASGAPLWSAPATTLATCGTVVWDGELIFASGGYPKGETAGIRADGSGTVAWRNPTKCYEQSILAHDGYVYAVNDGGIALCWRARDGKQMWKSRLPGGAVSASPVLLGNRIYLSNENATTFVFSTNPKSFELLGTNQLGTDAFATPSICGGRIYLRVGHGKGAIREEMLYCVGAPGQ